ncbi:MAG: glycosyltransferase family 9 protein [Candidatus Latescibacteria bacterium]|nr:glycosyltransferase family 9 protein [Candidatus Latescibacterota bacterium]
MKNRQIEHILVIRTGGIGDLVLSLPLLMALRKFYPHAWIEVMGHRSRLELLEGRYYADRICSVEQSGIASFFVQNGILPEELAQYFASFDLVISLVSDPDGLFSANLRRAGVERVIPIAPLPRSGSGHYSHYLLSQLRHWGVKAGLTEPKLFLAEADQEYASQFWREHGLGRVLAIHAGSGSPRKVWRPEGFVQVANWATEKLGMQVLLVSGPADQQATRQVVQEMKPRKPLMVENFSLTKLAALFQKCRVFVGNDSGITHIASAVGTPTVAVFGPSDPRIWAPQGKHTAVVKSSFPCSPCTRESMHRCQRQKCMDSITTEEVRKAVEMLLEGS